MSTHVSLRLPSALLERVDEAAARAGLSRTAYACRALELMLSGSASATASRPQGRLRQLAGAVCGGPLDLGAEHRHYLLQRIGDRR